MNPAPIFPPNRLYINHFFCRNVLKSEMEEKKQNHLRLELKYFKVQENARLVRESIWDLISVSSTKNGLTSTGIIHGVIKAKTFDQRIPGKIRIYARVQFEYFFTKILIKTPPKDLLKKYVTRIRSSNHVYKNQVKAYLLQAYLLQIFPIRIGTENCVILKALFPLATQDCYYIVKSSFNGFLNFSY